MKERRLGDYTAMINENGYVEYLLDSDGYRVHVYKRDGAQSWTSTFVKLSTLRCAPDGRYIYR